MMSSITAVPVGNVEVQLITDHDRVAWHEQKGGFEKQTLAKWAELCSAGRLMIDIGAYTGIYSIAARLLGCPVIAFEPMPFNRRRFIENAELNRVSPAVSEMAVTDYCGIADICYNDKVPLTSGASLTKFVGTAHHKVSTTTLDILKIGTLFAIKIDVEGAEYGVLNGAKDTIERTAPIILVEVLNEPAQRRVRDALPDYHVSEILDNRNLLMVPNC